MAKKKDQYGDYIYYIVDKLRVNYGLQWIFKNRRYTDFFNKIPCLQMCSITSNDDDNFIDGCLCSIKPFSSFTINLKSNYNIIPADQTIPQLTLNFPTKSMSELMTYTFINESLADKYSIKKLCFNYDYEENELNIIVAEMKNSLRQFDPRTTVLIILSQSDYFVKFLDAFRDILKYWLLNYETKCPFNEILIWGAIVDRLSVCRFNLNKHHCRIDTELLLIFITNPSLKAYTVHLDVNCDSSEKIYSKLREFNSEINLSVHSIAFMHISYFRMRLFFGLDVHIFKEIFPNVYLFTFYGDASFNGSYLKDTIITKRLPFYKMINLCTSILILSYD